MKFLIIAIAIFLTGCSTKNYFKETANKYNLNYHILRSIAEVESGDRSYTINVNDSYFELQKGAHHFNDRLSATIYINLVLNPLFLSHDVGICQINDSMANRYGYYSWEMLDDEKNIDVAGVILNWNLRKCKGDYKCALSMYNTGKGEGKEGEYYANKVFQARKKLFGY